MHPRRTSPTPSASRPSAQARQQASSSAVSGSFTGSSAGSSVQRCPVQTPPIVECDISSVNLKSKRTKVKVEDDDPPLHEITFKNKNRIEVIAGRTRTVPKTNVTLQVNKYKSCDDSKHPSAKVTEGANVIAEKKGAGALKFEAYTPRFVGQAGGWVVPRYWTGTAQPTVFKIQIKSCCERKRGAAVGNTTMQVRAYPSDECKLSFSYPFKPQQKKEFDDLEAFKSWTGEVEEEQKPGLSFEINGEEHDVGESLEAIWDAYQNAGTFTEMLTGLITAFEWSPVGFKAEFEWSFFTGSAELTWGWQENEDDENCHFHVEGSVDLVCFSASGTISYGFELSQALGLFKAAAVAELKVEDAGAGVKSTFERTEDGWQYSEPLLTHAELPIQADVRAEAGALYVTFAKIEGGVKTGFSGEMGVKLNDDDKFRFYIDLGLDEIVGFLTVSSWFFGSYEKEYAFTNAGKIFDEVYFPA